MDSKQRFRRVVEEHRDWVYSLAYYSLASTEDAEDVTQEVFVRLWKHFDSLDEKRVGGWLVQVARNLCVDIHRRRKHLRSQSAFFSNGKDPDLVRHPDPGPRAHYESGEKARRLMEEIRALEEPYRSLIILREIHQHTYAELTGLLDLPMNQVKVNLHRARKLLRERLKKEVAPQ